MAEQKWICVSAGGAYGSRDGWYQIVEGVLVLRDEGNHDNLAGNSAAVEFEGLTIEQAYEKRDAINAEPVGHSYDGCHSCSFGVRVEEHAEAPEWIAYSEPEEAQQLRELIRAFLSRKANFKDLRAAVDGKSVRQLERERWQEEIEKAPGPLGGPWEVIAIEEGCLISSRVAWEEMKARLDFLAYELGW